MGEYEEEDGRYYGDADGHGEGNAHDVSRVAGEKAPVLRNCKDKTKLVRIMKISKIVRIVKASKIVRTISTR